MSVAELPLRISEYDLDTDNFYEETDGVRLELPPMSIENDVLANQLKEDLGVFVRSRKLGRTVHEVLFELPLVDKSRKRRPDVAYLSYERWPLEKKRPRSGNSWPIAPELAVEYVSPNDLVQELTEKIRDYFEAGVLEVWVVHPEQRMVQIYESALTSHGLLDTQTLENRPLFPEFRYPIASFFVEA